MVGPGGLGPELRAVSAAGRGVGEPSNAGSVVAIGSVSTAAAIVTQRMPARLDQAEGLLKLAIIEIR